MTKAYSYIRFSSAKQALGDSLRRQHSKAVAYAAKHGLELDESLTYRDLGVSAYDGSNVRKGALGAFLLALRSGQVPPGSYLLVEQLDRLSRANPLSAMDVLREIIAAGVIVVTLSDKRKLTKDNVSSLENVILSYVVMSRAHEESERKSDVISDVWRAKRALKPPVFTKECPLWLRARDDRSGYDVIDERANSVRSVYELCAGGHGAVSIVRRANAERWPAPGKCGSWHTTLVSRLLSNRAVLGEYQPMTRVNGVKTPAGDPWPDYYPAIIDLTLFNLAQSARTRRKQLPRRRDNMYLNVFQGVLRCSCGSSFARKNKSSKIQPGYVQYQCTKRIRGASQCKTISALKLDIPLLRAIYSNAFVALAQDDLAEWTRNELISAQTQLDDEQTKLNKLIDALEAADDDSQALRQRIRQREQSVRELTALRDERAGWLDSLGAYDNLPGFEGDLAEAINALVGDEHKDFRASLHERITRVVDVIHVNAAESTAFITWRRSAPPLIVNL